MPQRHAQYYFKTGDIIFLVRGLPQKTAANGSNKFEQIADVLFKVPRYRLQWNGSGLFRTLSPAATDGRADDTPIALDVPLEEFESLMRIFYGP